MDEPDKPTYGIVTMELQTGELKEIDTDRLIEVYREMGCILVDMGRKLAERLEVGLMTSTGYTPIVSEPEPETVRCAACGKVVDVWHKSGRALYSKHDERHRKPCRLSGQKVR